MEKDRHGAVSPWFVRGACYGERPRGPTRSAVGVPQRIPLRHSDAPRLEATPQGDCLTGHVAVAVAMPPEAREHRTCQRPRSPVSPRREVWLPKSERRGLCLAASTTSRAWSGVPSSEDSGPVHRVEDVDRDVADCGQKTEHDRDGGLSGCLLYTS